MTEISAAAGSVRSARATERNLRTVTQEVSSEIDSTVAKLDKLGGKATISGQLMKAGFVGGGAALVSGFTSSCREVHILATFCYYHLLTQIDFVNISCAIWIVMKY